MKSADPHVKTEFVLEVREPIVQTKHVVERRKNEEISKKG
jgi:hypothetical protein